MRPRMYGSRLRKWWRTSTCSSCNGGVSPVASLKLLATASPCGRLSRTICLFCGMAASCSIGGNDVERVHALRAGGQALHVLEGAGRMRARLALGVVDGGFGERHRRGAVHQVALTAQPATRRLHETRLHLDRDDAHLLVDAARRNGHRDVEQGHAGAAVRDAERIEVLRFGFVDDLRAAVLEDDELEAEVMHERDVDAEFHIQPPVMTLT